MTIQKCPICFSGPHDIAASPVDVRNGDGSYTKHRQRSAYTNHDNRDCPWQIADYERQAEGLRCREIH